MLGAPLIPSRRWIIKTRHARHSCKVDPPSAHWTETGNPEHIEQLLSQASFIGDARLPRRPSGPGPVSPVIDACSEVAACGRLRLCRMPQGAKGCIATSSRHWFPCVREGACYSTHIVYSCRLRWCNTLPRWVVQLADSADAGEDNHRGCTYRFVAHSEV